MPKKQEIPDTENNARVQKALRSKKLTVGKLSSLINFPTDRVWKACFYLLDDIEVRDAIAEKLGTTRFDLWPDGLPIRAPFKVPLGGKLPFAPLPPRLPINLEESNYCLGFTGSVDSERLFERLKRHHENMNAYHVALKEYEERFTPPTLHPYSSDSKRNRHWIAVAVLRDGEMFQLVRNHGRIMLPNGTRVLNLEEALTWCEEVSAKVFQISVEDSAAHALAEKWQWVSTFYDEFAKYWSEAGVVFARAQKTERQLGLAKRKAKEENALQRLLMSEIKRYRETCVPLSGKRDPSRKAPTLVEPKDINKTNWRANAPTERLVHAVAEDGRQFPIVPLNSRNFIMPDQSIVSSYKLALTWCWDNGYKVYSKSIGSIGRDDMVQMFRALERVATLRGASQDVKLRADIRTKVPPEMPDWGPFKREAGPWRPSTLIMSEAPTGSLSYHYGILKRSDWAANTPG